MGVPILTAGTAWHVDGAIVPAFRSLLRGYPHDPEHNESRDRRDMHSPTELRITSGVNSHRLEEVGLRDEPFARGGTPAGLHPVEPGFSARARPAPEGDRRNARGPRCTHPRAGDERGRLRGLLDGRDRGRRGRGRGEERLEAAVRADGVVRGRGAGSRGRGGTSPRELEHVTERALLLAVTSVLRIEGTLAVGGDAGSWCRESRRCGASRPRRPGASRPVLSREHDCH